MNDGEKLTDIVGAVLKDWTLEQLRRGGRLGPEINEYALILHLAWIA